MTLRQSSRVHRNHCTQVSLAGFSLVECLICISILGVLTWIGTALLVQLLGVDSRITSWANEEVTIERLEERFRDAVNRSTSMELTVDAAGSEQELLLNYADQSEQFVVRPERVTWTRLSTSGQETRDEFLLPDREVQISVSDIARTNGSRSVRLTIRETEKPKMLFGKARQQLIFIATPRQLGQTPTEDGGL